MMYFTSVSGTCVRTPLYIELTTLFFLYTCLTIICSYVLTCTPVYIFIGK